MTTDGYVRLYRPEHPLAMTDGWVLEHRAVAWDGGLFTDPTLHVHHRDEDPTNNALENLEPMTHSEHGRRHGGSRALDRDEAVRLYLGGMTQGQVAEAMGTHGGKVSRMLKERGVVVRSGAHNRLVLDEATIVERLQAGEPVLRIARSLGINRAPIVRIRDAARALALSERGVDAV